MNIASARPTMHERMEWSRLAQDAYNTRRSWFGHRFSIAAARSEMTWPEFDTLQTIYRRWLVGGWQVVEHPEDIPIVLE